ncbi:hypothetical protein SD70_28570 [Gordoniibacillus kamchatkensis]|uniref:DUF1453 domain-containing protein n=1 Tax=Gordoniibacillus kamchatkensis TaxID=1590651 RepID=A0ABR5AB38_9BACL|nr:hypothetical protein [Paenibacillus sp. VKM B-2647]KIL38107.1 hypothetical protein SD70_28570 [Paenibacillus sp. VKM B-2647]
MNTNGVIITLIIIGAVIIAIIRQVMPQRIRLLPFVILPAIAGYESYRSLPRPTIPIGQIVECLLIVVAAVMAGAIQAAFTRVYYKSNQLYMCGGFVSLIAWVVLMFFRFIIGLFFQGFGMFTSYQSFEWILWAGVAATFGTRSIILYMKHPEIGGALAEERASRRRRRQR